MMNLLHDAGKGNSDIQVVRNRVSFRHDKNHEKHQALSRGTVFYNITRHLILASKTGEDAAKEKELEKEAVNIPKLILKKAEEKIPEKIPEKIIQMPPAYIQIPKRIEPMPLQAPIQIQIPKRTEPMPLQAPSLPFDFGKLNPFILDPSVSMIICEGPGKAIKIKKDGQILPAGDALTQEEINLILVRFSEQSKSRLQPIFRAKAGNLSMTAVLVPESRFLISKNP